MQPLAARQYDEEVRKRVREKPAPVKDILGALALGAAALRREWDGGGTRMPASQIRLASISSLLLACL